MKTVGDLLKVLIGFTFVRYIIVFLLGCVLGAAGMHHILVEMWQQFEAVAGIHGGVHLPSIQVNH